MSLSVKMLRAAAFLSIVAILALSLVPGAIRPHVMEEGRWEHFAAYLGSGSLFALCTPRWATLAIVAAVLSMCAGAVEIAQIWIPGRNASVIDFAFSSLGAWTGILWIMAARWAISRPQELAVSRVVPNDSARR